MVATIAAVKTKRLREEVKEGTLKFTPNMCLSGSCPPAELAACVQQIHLRDHAGCLIFKPGSLLRIVLLGILSGEVLEVEVT
jgi:hypothetical protein